MNTCNSGACQKWGLMIQLLDSKRYSIELVCKFLTTSCKLVARHIARFKSDSNTERTKKAPRSQGIPRRGLSPNGPHHCCHPGRVACGRRCGGAAPLIPSRRLLPMDSARLARDSCRVGRAEA